MRFPFLFAGALVGLVGWHVVSHKDPRQARLDQERAELTAAQAQLDKTSRELVDEKANIDRIQLEIEQTARTISSNP